jgi:hypothetical protein
MQKTIIRYGLIAGALIASLMIISTLIMKSIGFDKVGFDYSFFIGQSYIIASMSMIYFGIKYYRDTHNQGKITFGKGLLIGLGIMAIACVAYSLAWLVVYYNFIPNFIDDYTNYYINQIKGAGGGQAEIDKLMIEIKSFREWYKNPISIFTITLIEPTPVGLVIALISALILKKK